MSEMNAYCCECYENIKYTSSTLNFPQLYPILQLPIRPSLLAQFLWVQQHFPKVQPFTEALEPQALAELHWEISSASCFQLHWRDTR